MIYNYGGYLLWSFSRFVYLVTEITKLDPQHFVKMVTCCKESDSFSRMLVFEYQRNGTLSDWEGCVCYLGCGWMKIALSNARILRHIHTELQPLFAVTALTSRSIPIINFERSRVLASQLFVSSDVIVKNGPLNGIVYVHVNTFVQVNTFASGVILMELRSGRASLSKDTEDVVDCVKYIHSSWL
ncbi:probable LRR receptor-like serine/threonine-protein kinase At1g63430 isoform X2 [Lolium perenne]|uniref:probable LRR receptor-like serine/threonine-protein kinase At1g63430 isoform X2 n=1 Tax=Lolium perenne TaxID=4522 RepID=UPI003A99B72D